MLVAELCPASQMSTLVICIRDWSLYMNLLRNFGYIKMYTGLWSRDRTTQNIPLFSKPICDPPRIYPSFFNTYNATLPEYTPFFNTYMRAPRNYPSLPEYTPFSTPICDPPRISLSEYPSPLFNNYMRPSQKLLLPPKIYPCLQQLESQNLPLSPRI